MQWLRNLYTADDVKDQIYKLAKKGLTPSKIGTVPPHRPAAPLPTPALARRQRAAPG